MVVDSANTKKEQGAFMIRAQVTGSSVSSVRAGNRRVIQLMRRQIRNSVWEATSKGVAAWKNEVFTRTDRPTPFSLNSAGRQVRTAGSVCLGKVFIKPIQAKYMALLIDGGQSSELKPVPFDSVKNRYGNLPRRFTKAKSVQTIRRRGGMSDLILKGSGRNMVPVGVWSKRRNYRSVLRWPDKVYSAVSASLSGSVRQGML